MIIGISGKAETGKDWIVENIARPLGFFQFSFAWHFKNWLVATGQATWEEVFITKPPHIRHLLQQEGTEKGRNVYGDDIWCEAALSWINTLKRYNGVNHIVFGDCRFLNEAKFIQSIGGQVFRIVAPNRAAASKLTPEARLHISETALDNWTEFDAYLYNDFEDQNEKVFENLFVEAIESEKRGENWSRYATQKRVLK